MAVTYYLTQDVTSAKLLVYTNAFRKVREAVLSGFDMAGPRSHSVPASLFAGMANGTYYYYVEATGQSGKKAKSKIELMLIIK